MNLKNLPKNIQEDIQRSLDYAIAHPPQVGSDITIHFQGFYHARCTIIRESPKAYQIIGSPEGSNRKYTVWFPKKALEIQGYPCQGSPYGSFYGADIKQWFFKSMTPFHERLVGTLGN